MGAGVLMGLKKREVSRRVLFYVFLEAQGGV